MQDKETANYISPSEPQPQADDDYQVKVQELIELNQDLENLLNIINIGVIFLDSDLKIRKFTAAIKEVVWIEETDIKRPLTELSYKFNCANFVQLLEQVLQSGESVEQEIQLNAEEKYFLMGISPYYTEAQKCNGLIISFIRLNEVKKVQKQLQATLTALTQSEARLYLALSAGEIGTWIWKPEADSLVWDNRLIELCGLEPLQYPEKMQDWLNLVYPEDKAAVQNKIQQAIAIKQPFAIDYRVLKPDGAICYFSTKGKAYYNEQQKYSYFAGVTTNVTDIREAEQALRRSEKKYRYLYNNTPVMLHSVNQDRKIISVSNYWLEYLGYCREEVIGRNITEFFTPRSRLYAETEILPKYYSIGVCHDIPYEVVRKNGEVIEVLLSAITEKDASGTIIGSLGVMVDVTKRNQAERELSCLNQELEARVKRRTIDLETVNTNLSQEIRDRQKAQQALKKSEIYFRNTFEKAGIGIAHISLEGKFLLLNQKFCQIAGYPHETLINLTLKDITHPDDLELDQKYIQETIAGIREGYTVEKRYIRADASSLWVNLTISSVKNPQNKPEYFIAAIQDITKRKKMAQALTRANKAKDTFISQINHELRTPLNSILGFTQILQQDPDINSRQQQVLDVIANSGKYLQELVDSILEFSKFEAGKSTLEQKEFNLSQLLDTVAQIIRHRAEKKQLIFNYCLESSVPVVVKGDRIKLQQLLLNLLDNAVKFTDLGMINFHVSTLDHPESNPSLAQVRFQINDTGVGISNQDMKNIFKPFVHIEKDGITREGTGLGLTISQKIAQLMNSQIHFKSQEGEGTTCWFHLELPTGNISNLGEQIAVEVAPFSLSQNHCPKILVVDDITENRFLLVQYLTSLGCEIAEAVNGKQCLEIASIFKPEAILLDILMPEMNGIETLKNLRQNPQLQDTVVIFISANPQFEAELRTANLKFEDFLLKPIDFQKLSRSLSHNLSWVPLPNISESPSRPMKSPSIEQLQEILHLAELGDMDSITKLANTFLQDSDHKYRLFFQEVNNLARTFQQYKLIEFLEGIIAHKSSYSH